MAKSKTQPSIEKPVFDPEAALRFAAEGAPPGKQVVPELDRTASRAPSRSATKARSGYTEVPVLIRDELLPRARAEAARKGKTLDELIEKLISKHLGKH
jgi:hypothetical protein